MTDNKAQADDQNLETDSPISSVDNPTIKPNGRKYNPIKKAKNQNEKKPTQQNKIKQDELVKWTVFVQEETKTAVGKAIQKAGTTVTDWVDSRLRQAATEELTRKSKPPAKVEDVTDIIKEMAETLKANQEATTKAQNDLIERQGQQIQELVQTVKNSQPKSLKEMLFGKSKAD